MKYWATILFVLFSFLSHSQSGGRMKERKNQKRLLHHIAKGGWHYNPTRPGKTQSYRREGRKLFHRSVTKGEVFRSKHQAKINRDRARKRVRGNLVFAKRKYHRV
jgi:hypothetical protein